MKPRYLIIILSLIILSACDNRRDNIVYIDDTAPLPPVGIVSISLDNAVELQWIENQEIDIDGYFIYVSDRYDGRYEYIGNTRATTFVDRGARNGFTSYYAVSAYDFDGNESELSRDVVYDTPRPEGRDVALVDRFVMPHRSGYDFSEYSVLHFDTDFTDFFFEVTAEGIPYLVVWDDSEIQDMGFTSNLDEINSAPNSGWNPTGDALAVRGHTYVIKTFDNHYAKIRLVDISTSGMIFDWAYQVARGNPELLRAQQQSLQKRHRSLSQRH
ncbi:MAG: hypothetical protein IH600_14590 [Bacteroidetes bacterium]|nr:hypothetical protein [Bacteroidota bacterium]